jgi:dolichyl-phosphate-mannose--protein O-mannosyl transferase
VTFLLAGLYAYVAGRPVVAGAMIAAATCCKLTGLGGVVAIVIFECGRTWNARTAKSPVVWSRLMPLAWMAGSVVVFLPALLFILNLGVSIFPNPFDNLFYVYTHQAATYSFRPPGPIPQSRPWEWLLNREEITYFNQGVQHLRGLFNPLLIFAAVPVTAWAVFGFIRKRSETALMVIAMVGGFYLPLVAASVQTPRQTYLYYFLPTLPALAIGVSALGGALPIPRVVRLLYLVAALAAFAYYFPFRGMP